MNAPDAATRDRYRGALLGLAAGDALGTTVEFRPPGTFAPVVEITGGGPFALEAGQWTDDTSMALCLAESLIECRGFDLADQLRRYVRWWREGHLSATGECFDIGTTTRRALDGFRRTGEPCAPADEFSAGNGSIMRLAPVPMFWANDADAAAEFAARSSTATHAAPEAVGACRYLAAILARALNGAPRAELTAPIDGLPPGIAAVAAGSYRALDPPEIAGTGYVVKSLEAALWAFHRGEDFADGARLAVNLGDDADTTGAVYGQIAGAFHGAGGIPERWRAVLAMRDRIKGFADRLLDLRPPPPASA